MGRIDGKVCVVTGGAAGIGAAAARLLAREGGQVAIIDVDGDGADRVAAEIGGVGGDAIAVQADLARIEDVRRSIEATVECYGGVDVLFNNAAHVPPPRTKVVDVDLDEWALELQVNLTAPLLLAKLVIPEMISRGGGSFVHTSSTAGLQADDTRTGYGVTKAGLLGLSRAIAAQYGKHGIRSNVIAPGMTLTTRQLAQPAAVLEAHLAQQMTPRLGLPEDQAAAVLFLASDEAAFITGQVLAVDGGQTTRLPVTPAL